MPIRFKIAALSLLLAAFCASCGIDFQTKAVEKARAYALDNLRQLDETQRNFIRYTDPVVMNRVIYRMHSGEGSGDMMQTCMVWNVPGVNGSVVVAGHGERSLWEWSPDRIVIEEMNAPDAVMAKAVSNAIVFAMNRMLHLSDAERNRLRFTPPEIYQTKFDISPEALKDAGRPLSRWEAYLKSKEAKTTPVQYSIVWKSMEEGKQIVVCGFTPDKGKGLEGWKPQEGMVVSALELESAKSSGNIAPEWPPKDSKALKAASDSASGTAPN